MGNSDFKSIDDGMKLHLQEAEFMKKEWISYVYSTINELSSRITTNTLQIQKEREHFITSLIKLNDKITLELSKNSNINKYDLERLSTRLNDNGSWFSHGGCLAFLGRQTVGSISDKPNAW